MDDDYENVAIKEEQKRHSLELSYGKDASDLVSRWANGKSCWTIEMGGLGPGYEQALQIAMFEVLRFFVLNKPDAAKWEVDSEWRKQSDELDGCLKIGRLAELSLSGAQWGAAKQLAARFYKFGPIQVMQSCPDEGRKIQVSDNIQFTKPKKC